MLSGKEGHAGLAVEWTGGVSFEHQLAGWVARPVNLP